jgi:hypothetical protein
MYSSSKSQKLLTGSGRTSRSWVWLCPSTPKKGNTFLNFRAKYPNQTFTGYIPAGSELSGDRWTITLQGKVIGLTGTVELYQGKPEIKVLSRSQIHE